VQEKMEVGFQVFASDGARSSGPFATFRRAAGPEFVIYVENAGDFTVPMSAVDAVHSEKVILNCAKLDNRLRRAIGQAHDGEEPGA
jgi:hypothetical protein